VNYRKKLNVDACSAIPEGKQLQSKGKGGSMRWDSLGGEKVCAKKRQSKGGTAREVEGPADTYKNQNGCDHVRRDEKLTLTVKFS